MRERDKMKTLASKTNDPDFFLKYKQLRNKMTKACRVTKDLYYNTLVLENLDNQDRLWKALKTAIPQTSTAAETICLVEDEVEISAHHLFKFTDISVDFL